MKTQAQASLLKRKIQDTVTKVGCVPTAVAHQFSCIGEYASGETAGWTVTVAPDGSQYSAIVSN